MSAGRPSTQKEARAPSSDRAASAQQPHMTLAEPARPSDGSRALRLVRGLVRTMRPHQWVKNVFVLAPVVFAKEIFDASLLENATSAFFVFCLLAGAVS